ncbi:MAG: hypothetical protein HW412_997 [Bacteroidetes bacterium]|nr:hypothetical protein [Bacteroidota bacterium]
MNKVNLHATKDHRVEFYKLERVEAEDRLAITGVNFCEEGNRVRHIKGCIKTLHSSVQNVTSFLRAVLFVIQNPVEPRSRNLQNFGRFDLISPYMIKDSLCK